MIKKIHSLDSDPFYSIRSLPPSLPRQVTHHWNTKRKTSHKKEKKGKGEVKKLPTPLVRPRYLFCSFNTCSFWPVVTRTCLSDFHSANELLLFNSHSTQCVYSCSPIVKFKIFRRDKNIPVTIYLHTKIARK